MERLDGKIEFIVKSGHYKGFAAQAFNIWYDITKLHILHNGNKRMAFACFILYCNKNGKKPKGSIKNFKEISLYIAESKSGEKERVIHELKQRIAFIDIKWSLWARLENNPLYAVRPGVIWVSQYSIVTGGKTNSIKLNKGENGRERQ